MEKVFKNKLILVDGHALLHRAFHALSALTNKQGFPTGAIFGFFSILFKAFADLKPTHVLVTFDVKGPTFRDKLTTDYKAHRKPTPDELTAQLPMVKEILCALDVPIFEQEGYEADDLLGIIAHRTPKDFLNIILTGDMDMLQLINENTVVYRLKTGISQLVAYDEDKMKQEFGLTPSQWVDFKALKGDASDNIPGVAGIGEKTALDLIQRFGTLEKLYKAVKKKDETIKPAVLNKLIAGEHYAFLSQKLAKIDGANKLELDLSNLKLTDYDQSKVIKLFNELEIKSLIPRLPKTNKPASSLPEPPIIENKPNKLIKSEAESLIAAYLLNPGRRTYDTSDWKLLAQQLEDKKLVPVFNDIETPLINVLDRMSKTGIKLDLKWLQTLSEKLAKRINELTKQIHKEAGSEFNIASPIQLREILFDKLKITSEHLKKTAQTKALSTAAEQLEKLRGLHPIIDLIFEYRELTKLKSTYVDALPQLVGKDGRIHTTYSQTIAATGRLSSLNPNLQNIPIRTELGQKVRKAFVAEKGFLLASLDYSQIELRIAADFANDPEMIKIFKSEGDFHTATASRIFGVKESEVTPGQRRDAKTINFSVLYGVSAFGLSERSEMQRAEAGEFIKKYYQVFSKLKDYIDDSIKKVHQKGYAVNPLGRIRYFPEIHASNFAVRSAAERAAVNMPLQSLAADILKMAMLRIDKQIVSEDCRMLLTVHDELVFEIQEDKVGKYVPQIKKIMESVYKLKVPIAVDAKVGKNWMEMEKYAA